jgi:hypothetical protein
LTRTIQGFERKQKGAKSVIIRDMHRQSIIFISLLLIMAIAIVAVGYATGRGPLAVVSDEISRLSSGSIPNRLRSRACMDAWS